MLPLRDHSDRVLRLSAGDRALLARRLGGIGWRAGPAGARAGALAAIYCRDGATRRGGRHRVEPRHHHARAHAGGRRRRRARTPSRQSPSCSKAWIRDLFWNGVLDRPFRLFGLRSRLPRARAARSASTRTPTWATSTTSSCPPTSWRRRSSATELVVYDVRGPRLRNITARLRGACRAKPGCPLRVDAASPLTSYLLGPEWYQSDGDHRWMPRARHPAHRRTASPGACNSICAARVPRKLLKRVTPRRVTVDGRSLRRDHPPARPPSNSPSRCPRQSRVSTKCTSPWKPDAVPPGERSARPVAGLRHFRSPLTFAVVLVGRTVAFQPSVVHYHVAGHNPLFALLLFVLVLVGRTVAFRRLSCTCHAAGHDRRHNTTGCPTIHFASTTGSFGEMPSSGFTFAPGGAATRPRSSGSSVRFIHASNRPRISCSAPADAASATRLCCPRGPIPGRRAAPAPPPVPAPPPALQPQRFARPIITVRQHRADPIRRIAGCT